MVVEYNEQIALYLVLPLLTVEVTNKNSNKVVLGISPVLLLYTGFTLDRVVLGIAPLHPYIRRKNRSK